MSSRKTFTALFILTAIFPLSGCGTGSTPSPKSEAGVATNVKRGMELQDVKNQLRNIGQMYLLYNQERTQSPSLEDFKASLKRDAGKERQALEEGRYVLLVTENPTGNVILAHEKAADHNGNRVVVMGDGGVKMLNEQEFQAALKKK